MIFLTTALLFIEFMLLYQAARRSGPVFYPTLFLCYIVYCQIIYTLVVNDIVIDEYLLIFQIGGTRSNEFETQLFYFLFFFAIFWMGRDIRFSGNFRSSLRSNLVRRAAHLAIVALAVYAGLLCFALDWRVVWENSVYLSMTDPRIALDSATSLNITLLSLLLPSGLLAACLAGACFGLRDTTSAIILTVYSGFASLYFLASHQRGAAVIAVVLLTTLLVAQERRSKFAGLLLAIYVCFSYTVALEGRGSGHHGITSIPDSLALVGNLDVKRFLDGFLTNLAEGVFVFAEALSYPASYPTTYELLSFMPTPSALDGFSSVRDLYQVRLHTYVPFSGYIEAIKFGPIYVLALVICIYGITKINQKLALLSPISFLIVNSLTFSGLLVLNSYPIRTGLRVIWIAYAIGIIVLVALRTNGNSSTIPPSSIRRGSLQT